MTAAQIEAYLSAALDQEACEPTLTAALLSRVTALRAGGSAAITLLQCLENLCAEPGQLNCDVIEAVADWLLAEMVGACPDDRGATRT